MIEEKVELSIARVSTGNEGERVRLDIRQGQHIVARLDMSLLEYARAQFGEACVPVSMTKGRSRAPD